jgi:hypothetical protein
VLQQIHSRRIDRSPDHGRAELRHP